MVQVSDSKDFLNQKSLINSPYTFIVSKCRVYAFGSQRSRRVHLARIFAMSQLIVMEHENKFSDKIKKSLSSWLSQSICSYITRQNCHYANSENTIISKNLDIIGFRKFFLNSHQQFSFLCGKKKFGFFPIV